MRICPKCSLPNADEARACAKCGSVDIRFVPSIGLNIATASDDRLTQMVSRQEKAEAFVDHAKLFAMAFWEPCVKLKPYLWQAVSERGHEELTHEVKCFKWDFLHIVAMTWWGVNLAKVELPEAEFRNIARTLESQIANWNRGGEAAFSDLNKFIQGYEPQYRKMVELHEVTNFTKLLVGTWLLWNLTNKAKFDDEAGLANMLGSLVYEAVAGYWKVPE